MRRRRKGTGERWSILLLVSDLGNTAHVTVNLVVLRISAFEVTIMLSYSVL
jgi:hypothetical protein